jgi:fructose-bisphosphate aldolase, class II
MEISHPAQFLRFAFEQRFAYPAFNVWNLEVAKALVQAAAEEAAPVILQTFYGDLHYSGSAELSAATRAVIAGSPVPILLHLDHPDGMQMVVRCLQLGYRSVMFDGGALPLGENIAATAQAVEIGHAFRATVEAELGQFGGEHQGGSVMEANPEDCERLVKETGVDMLAVSAGSVHGQKSRLNISLLRDIARRVQRPLVLHGGSGIAREDTDLALQEGVVKINIGAAIFEAWIAGLREGLDPADSDEGGHEPLHYSVTRQGMRRVTEVARERIRRFRASGQAPALRQLLFQSETAVA